MQQEMEAIPPAIAEETIRIKRSISDSIESRQLKLDLIST